MKKMRGETGDEEGKERARKNRKHCLQKSQWDSDPAVLMHETTDDYTGNNAPVGTAGLNLLGAEK